MNGFGQLVWAAVVVAFAACEQSANAQHTPLRDTTPYIVKSDDSLYTLTDRYMQDPGDWRLLRDINHIVNPLHLHIGSSIAMPSARLKQNTLTARVIAIRGSVEKKTAPKMPFIPVTANTLLQEGDEVRTGRDAFISMVLPDGSHVVLPSSSQIRITRLRATLLTGAIERRFDLKQGEITNDVAPLGNPRDSYRVTSPSVVAGVRGTQFRVRYLPQEDATTVEVLGGKVGVDGSMDGSARPQPFPGMAPIVIAAGYGNVTRRGETVGTAVPLLAAPDIVDPGRVQHLERVEFELTPVNGAQAYRTEIASDAGFLDLLRDQRSSGLHVEFNGIPNGSYFVRVSATDQHGIDGLPQVYSFSRYMDTTNAAVTATESGSYAFRWLVDPAARNAHYRFVLSTYRDMRAPLIDMFDVTGGEMSVTNLAPGKYYWTIVTDVFENGRLLSVPSEIHSFTQAR